MPDISDIKKINVQIEDGSIWEAHYDEDDAYLYFDKMITPPPPKPIEPQESPEEPIDEDDIPNIEELKELIDKMKTKGKTPEEQSLKDADIPDDIKENMDDKVFRAKLQSVMLDNKYDRRLRGRTRGKVDMKALPKVPTLARSVFTQKVSRKNKEYNVCLLVDESDSMSEDNKCVRAAEVTCFLAKNFEGININLSIVGFNKCITVLKEWDTKVNYEKVFNDIRTMNNRCGGGWNNDYDAIYRGITMFDTAPKGQNILIMMSDGQPDQFEYSEYYGINGEIQERAKIEKNMPKIDYDKKQEISEMHKLVNSHKDIIYLGVGILEGGQQIPNHIVVNNLYELKSKIILQLKKLIKRG